MSLMQKWIPFASIFINLLVSFLPAAPPPVIQLTDNLGFEEIEKATESLSEMEKRGDKSLVILVNSNSGDLIQVLNFAKRTFALKASKDLKVDVYIQDTALGPAAMIPFLADRLYTSHFVSWGDIPLGTQERLPTNILRNSVESLISPKNPAANLLTQMAIAMSDPSVQAVEDDGLKIVTGKHKNVLAKEWETLVVNHNQLKNWGLISGFLTKEQFLQKYFPKSPSKVPTETGLSFKLAEELKKHIPFSEEGPNTVGLIQIDDKKSQISQATWIYVKNALDYYKKKKPALIILELNTPGGEVFAAQRISDALKDIDTQHNIPVVCFINNWAISAGAMLAYSCRFIAITKDATMGAAEPVIPGESGQMVAASEKVNSALRKDFANRAAFFDRNRDIAEAMVDKDLILVMRFGKIVRLDNEDQIRRGGPNPDIIITTKGKLLTLDAKEMIEYGVANLLLSPKKLTPITESEKERGKWPASKLLLFQNAFFQKIPEATVDLYQMDWKTRFLSLISSPIVTSILFLGMLLGFYLEMNTPGFGFPGSIALMCLFLIILSSYALEVANILEVILLLAGVVFVLLDLFLIPTFGILGISGVILFFIGLFGLMLPGIGSVEYEFDTQTFNAAGEAFMNRLAWLSATLVIAVLLIAFLGRYIMPTFSGFQRFVLMGNQTGYIATAQQETLPPPGSKGEVLATLRPAGKVLIHDEIFDAISYGEFIEKGTPIIVDKLDGSVIVVNKVT